MFVWLLILILAVPICMAVFFIFSLCCFTLTFVEYRKDPASVKPGELRRYTILLILSIVVPVALGLILWGMFQLGLLRISFM